MKVDQCLFGYSDGHRLLATSLSLGSETSSLTELSDMAPGTVFDKSDGYWTGFPAPSIGRYVLMRTWPAPEMSRPGCVWTHALLIEPSVLESLPNLAVLQKCMRRPVGPAEASRYREPLEISDASSFNFVDEKIVGKLLLALYQKDRAVVHIDYAGELDEPLFAVWSQQWPKLRRNLRFQTAAARLHHSSSSVRFDISAEIGGLRESTQSIADSVPWVSAAVLDVQQGVSEQGGLRSFLWRYGSDVKRQRKSFRPLTELYLLDCDMGIADGSRVVQMVINDFATFQDAFRLKQDLMDGLVAPFAQPAAFRAFFEDQVGAVLPPPTVGGIERLAGMWHLESKELLAIADLVATEVEPIADLVFSAFTAQLSSSTFWIATANYPQLRDRMLRDRPELLLEVESLQLDDETLAEFLKSVPITAAKLPAFVSLLLSRESKKLADVVFEKFPKIAAAELLQAENHKALIGRVWRSAMLSRPKLILTSEYLGSLSRTSLLYSYLEALGGLVPDVLAAGAGPWVGALQNASNDLWGEQEDTLRSFILTVALLTGSRDGQRAVEMLFDVIHGKILRDKLHREARDLLLPCLPQLGWFSNWDIGLRLRLMVTTAYINNSWPAQSFAALTADPKVRSMLADAAEGTKGGEPFFKAISG